MNSLRHLTAVFTAITAVSVSANAATIANWKELSGVIPAIPAANLNTDAPTFGDGTNASAQSSWIGGRFGTTATPASVTLAEGQTLTVSGSLVLTGASNNNEYRFGIYNDGGQFAADDGTGWTGGWLHQVGADIYTGRTDGPFISTGGDSDPILATKTSSGTINGNSSTPFTFSMSITRDSATTVDISASFAGGGGGLNQVYEANDVATSLFTYTASGILFAGGSTVDLAQFSGMQYSVIPEPSAIGFLGLAAGVLMLRRRR